MAMTKYGSLIALLLLTTACGGGEEQEHAARDVSPGLQEGNLVRLGDSTRAAGDTESAERLYRDAIAQSKGSPMPYLALADLYQSQKQPLKAISVLKEGVAQQPESPQMVLALANTLVAGGNSHEALKYAKQAVKLSPEDPRAYNTQGVALDNTGQYEEAQASYERAIRLSPKNTGYIQNNLALSYIMSDDYKDAIDLLKPMAESKESTQTLRQNLALAYGLSGDEKTAKEWMMKDLSEDKANENLAFYKHYSKERLISGKTTSDTAVESVAARDLDVPADLLDTSSPAPAKVASAPAQPIVKEPVDLVSMTPIFKPDHIAKNTAEEGIHVSENASSESVPMKAPILKPRKEQLAKATPVKKDEFDENYVEEKMASKAMATAEPAAGPTPKLKPSHKVAGNISAADIIEEAAKLDAPEAETSAATTFAVLPRPYFKPRLD